jgi:hypothetical protein
MFRALPFCGLLLAVHSQMAFAQQPKATSEKSSVEKQLFDDLNSPAEQSPSRNKRSPAKEPGEDIGSPSRSDSPLAEIGQQMRQVETRLRQRDTSATTRQLQAQILERLTKLLQSQQSQTSQSTSSTSKARTPSDGDGGSGGKAGTQSGNESGTGTQNQSVVNSESIVKSADQIWGVLPERVQQRMQAAANEEFLPQYQQRIQQYYERLAERNKKK